MLRVLSTGSNDSAWLGAFARDFQRRFLSLLSYQFRSFPAVLALSINESANQGARLDTAAPATPLSKAELDALFSPFDLKRLDSYANNMLDYHVILDMIPTIATLYFTSRLSPSVSLTGVQSSILLAIGLQRKVLEDVEKELGLKFDQLLAMFVKIVRKVSAHFRKIVEMAVEGTIPGSVPTAAETADEDTHGNGDGNGNEEVLNGKEDKQQRYVPLPQNLDEELAEGGAAINRELKEKQRALIDALPLERYEVETGGAEWEEAERLVQKRLKHGDGKEKDSEGEVTVSVKSEKKRKGKSKGETAEEVYKAEIGDREAKRLKVGMSKLRKGE